MSNTDHDRAKERGRVTQDEFIELASFEGPDAYWSIEAIHDPDSDTFTIWVCTDDGPKEPLATGVGRWFSHEHEWSDYDG